MRTHRPIAPRTLAACGGLAVLLFASQLQAQTGDPASSEPGGSSPDAGGGESVPVEELPAELRPEMTLEVRPERELHVGDPIQVTLTAVAPKGTRITVPERDLSPFEILERSARTEAVPGEKERHVFELTLITFDADAGSLPPFELRVVTPDQHIGSMFTEPRELGVRSLVENEPDAEPQGETEPVVVMEDDYTLAWVGAGLLGALLMAGLGFWLARWYRQKPKAQPAPPPPRPPWELALEDLEALRAERDPWIAEGRAAEYVDRISDVLREYLGARYGFDGLESTTDEVVETLSAKRPRELPMTDVVTLLEECDLVKFARATPEAELCDDLHAQATRMVQRSIPRAPESEESR